MLKNKGLMSDKELSSVSGGMEVQGLNSGKVNEINETDNTSGVEKECPHCHNVCMQVPHSGGRLKCTRCSWVYVG